jgi:hypothetical protein
VFDNWARKVADKFEEDEPIFRTERSRMRYLMSLLEGSAERSVEARHQSATRPFSCLAEMIQVLAAAYHDPNQATAARTALREHHYDPRGNPDIHGFIADFNSLATKARIPEDQWKGNLWDHIPPLLDPRLLHDAEDEDISYEEFCDRVAKAAYSTQRDYDIRQKERRSREPGESNGSRTRRDDGKGRRSSNSVSKPKTSSDTGRALSAAEKKVHWDANTCFNCGKTGHQAAGCPRKKKIATVEVGSSSSSDKSKRIGPSASSLMVPMSSMAEVDGKKRSNAFTKNTHIQVNGIGLPAIALCDTGAQTHLLVSPAFARRARKQLQACVTRLDKPIQLLDYRKQPAGRVEKKLIATLEIDGRRFPDQSFLVTETGHDVFIGLHWMEEHGLLLDCKTHNIIWPDDLPAIAKFSSAIELPPRCLLDGYVRPEIQKDVDCRDKAMAKADKKYQILRRSWRGPERNDTASNAPQTEVLDASDSAPEPKTDKTTPSISALEAAEDQQVVAALVPKIEADSRRNRWESLINSLPQEVIPLETQRDTDEIDPVETEEVDNPTAIRQQIAQLQLQVDGRLPESPLRQKRSPRTALIPPEKIDMSIAATSSDSPSDVDVPRGTDQVELIRQENKSQGLGMRDGKLLVPEKTSDDKIFSPNRSDPRSPCPKKSSYTQDKIRSSKFWNESTHGPT